MDGLYPGDPEADGYLSVQHLCACVRVCRFTMGASAWTMERGGAGWAHHTPNAQHRAAVDERSVGPGKGPRSSRQPRLTGLADHVLLALATVECYWTVVTNHAADRPRFVFCIGRAAAGTEQRDQENLLLLKHPKERQTQRSLETGRHLALSVWHFRARNDQYMRVATTLLTVRGSRPRHPSPSRSTKRVNVRSLLENGPGHVAVAATVDRVLAQEDQRR